MNEEIMNMSGGKITIQGTGMNIISDKFINNLRLLFYFYCNISHIKITLTYVYSACIVNIITDLYK